MNGFGMVEGIIGVGDEGTMPVTCLQNVAMARKQNLAGVVNENKIGRTCAASRYGIQMRWMVKGMSTYHRRPAGGREWLCAAPQCPAVGGIYLELTV